MKEKNVVTLPITKDGYLEGLITIGDIATSYMDVYDSSILSKAKTSYRNIVETLDAELLVGDETAIFDAGKVLVAAESLAEIAGITVESYANEMFLAASNMCNKSEEEIFFQDFKKFSTEEVTFGISQITSLNAEELKMIGERIKPCLEQFRQNQKVDMVFFMLTDIAKESTTLLYAGEDAASLLEVLYGHSGGESCIELQGVVSRKKQLVSSLIQAVQQI